MFIKDSSGNRSLTATLAVIGFGVVMFKVLLSGGSIGTVSFGSIDSLSIAAILGPVLGTYTARRWGNPTPTDAPAEDAGSKPSNGAA
jgi:hypothetical protein